MANPFPTVANTPINVDEIVSNSNVPKIYSNSFAFGNTLTDVTAVFHLNKSPVAVIIMDFTAVKTLYKSLGLVIGNIEKGLGHEIKDMNQVMIEWDKNINPGVSENSNQEQKKEIENG
jgi:hypothetical protein